MHTHFQRIANCQINRILMKGQTVVIAKFSVYYFLASSRLFKWNTMHLDMHIRTRCVWIMTMHFRKNHLHFTRYKHFFSRTVNFESVVFYVRGYNPKAFSRNICSRLKFYVQDHISLLRHIMLHKKCGSLQFQKFSNLWLLVKLLHNYVHLSSSSHIANQSVSNMELWSRKSRISCNVGIMGGLTYTSPCLVSLHT